MRWKERGFSFWIKLTEFFFYFDVPIHFRIWIIIHFKIIFVIWIYNHQLFIPHQRIFVYLNDMNFDWRIIRIYFSHNNHNMFLLRISPLYKFNNNDWCHCRLSYANAIICRRRWLNLNLIVYSFENWNEHKRAFLLFFLVCVNPCDDRIIQLSQFWIIFRTIWNGIMYNTYIEYIIILPSFY